MKTGLNQIVANGRVIFFHLKIFKQSRHVRILINRGGQVVVTAPKHYSKNVVENFIKTNAVRISNLLDRFTALPKKEPVKYSVVDKRRLILLARRLAKERLNYFNQFYNFSYGKISIRNQRTRWGSCSRRGDISLNFRIATISPELADYVIVHELCHLEAFNHSAKFWNLVSRTIPNYKIRRKQLRIIGLSEG